VFITKATGISFYLNTTPSTFNEAELGCQMNGGHLAAYSSFAEQQVGARCDSTCPCSPPATPNHKQPGLVGGVLLSAFTLQQKRLSTNTGTVPPVQEVEQYYIENYYIMPLFHKQYWMGYRAKTWGENNFAVLDSTVPLDPNQNSTQRYYHWGNMTTVMPNKTVIVRRNCSLLAASCLNNQTAMDEVRCWGRNPNYQAH
jgi:hypothetical protein